MKVSFMTCLRLARDGKAQATPAKIAAVDVAASPGLDTVVKELIALGAEAIALHGDMATADAPGKVVASAIERFGGLDGLVSNAGVNRPGPLAQYSVADWDFLFAGPGLKITGSVGSPITPVAVL